MRDIRNAADITLIEQLVIRERESRDMGLWSRMHDCFHADAEVNISWFQGSGPDFVEASKDMLQRGMAAKHRLGPVLVTLNNEDRDEDADRAIATLSAIIDIPTILDDKEFNLAAHSFLIYRVEKRDGQWRLASFEVIYRRDEFSPAILGQSIEIDPEALRPFRPSYRNLSYSLSLKGYPVNNALAGEDRPETCQAILDRVFAWAGIPVPE